MISHQHNCIFVHIPKTGGSSIERLIWPLDEDRTEENLWMGLVRQNYNKYQTGGLQHLLAHQVREEVGSDIFESYYKFAFVRNPWDKAVSQFEFMKKRKSLRNFIGMRKGDSFKKYLNLIQKKNHVQWDSQYKFVLDEDGEMLVDKICYFEKFEQETLDVLSAIKFHTTDEGINIPHEKKSTRLHYSDYYDDESRDLVGCVFNKDVELFGYTF